MQLYLADMSTCRHILPGFKASCISVAVLYVLLGGSILLRGTSASMEPYGVPETTLASPHYQDAIFWVYSHMIAIGLLTGCIGLIAEGDRSRKWAARLLLAVHLYYTYLDTRSSDSFLGNALYKGTASIAPAIIVAIVSILFAHASFCTAARAK